MATKINKEYSDNSLSAVVDMILDTIREQIKSGQIAINSINSSAWIYKDFTAMKLSILSIMAQELLGKEFHLKEFLEYLINNKIVKSYAGGRCIYQINIYYKDQYEPFNMYVICFENNILWGQNTPQLCGLRTEITELDR